MPKLNQEASGRLEAIRDRASYRRVLREKHERAGKSGRANRRPSASEDVEELLTLIETLSNGVKR